MIISFLSLFKLNTKIFHGCSIANKQKNCADERAKITKKEGNHDDDDYDGGICRRSHPTTTPRHTCEKSLFQRFELNGFECGAWTTAEKIVIFKYHVMSMTNNVATEKKWHKVFFVLHHCLLRCYGSTSLKKRRQQNFTFIWTTICTQQTRHIFAQFNGFVIKCEMRVLTFRRNSPTPMICQHFVHRPQQFVVNPIACARPIVWMHLAAYSQLEWALPFPDYPTFWRVSRVCFTQLC